MFKKKRKRNKNTEGIINHYDPCILSSSSMYTLINYLELKIASFLYHSVDLRYLITQTERYSLYEINVSLEVSRKRPPHHFDQCLSREYSLSILNLRQPWLNLELNLLSKSGLPVTKKRKNNCLNIHRKRNRCVTNNKSTNWLWNMYGMDDVLLELQWCMCNQRWHYFS